MARKPHAPEHGGEHHAKLSGHAKHVGRDGMAHSSHHALNREHGAGSFDSPPEYEDGGCDHHLGDNVASED